MAYQGGTATSSADLFSIISTFCAAHGFTSSGYDLIAGSGAHTRFTIGNPSVDNAASDIAGDSYYTLGLAGSYAGDFTTDCTPLGYNNSAAQICISVANWPVSYYLYSFSSPSTCICILNYGSYYNWLMFGDIFPTSALFNGGNFLAATYPALAMPYFRGFVPREIGLTVGKSGIGGLFLPVPISTAYSSAYIWENSWCYTNIGGNGWGPDNRVHIDPRYPALLQLTPSQFGNTPVLFPVRLVLNTPGFTCIPIGEIKYLRLLKMDCLSPGDTITIGGDVWKVFPFCQKNTVYPMGYDNCIEDSLSYTAAQITASGEAYRHGPQTGTFAFAVKSN